MDALLLYGIIDWLSDVYVMCLALEILYVAAEMGYLLAKKLR